MREGRIPWSHGKSHTQAREQLPPQTTQQPLTLHNNYYQYNHYYRARGSLKDMKKGWNVDEQVWTGDFQTIVNEEDMNGQQHNYCWFPLRDVNQESSIASVGWEPGEFKQEVEPKAIVLNRQCKSWLSPHGTRSNLVSQRDGWRDIEVINNKNYSFVRMETNTIAVGQHYYHSDLKNSDE